MKKILYLFIILLMASCTNVEKKTIFKDVTLSDNIFYVANTKKVFTGSILEKYENGQIKTEAEIKNGRYNGEVKNYYENGNLKSLFYYVDGILDGEQSAFYENGAKMYTLNYSKGVYDKQNFIFSTSKIPQTMIEFKNGKLIKQVITKQNGDTEVSDKLTKGFNALVFEAKFNATISSLNGTK